ncbi:hypothetical protein METBISCDRAFT_22399 [Metschnikowia bicuspidata]|uniref:Uncharacterized protein n=1 Tax=Metschnikowia bicuspidata TaxID=27322 RepID=A0A4P9ZEF3_9ASCO|nr:hypothetical protein METBISCDRAFT_22399 [Metschnikowia bicuspidata]
MASPICVSNPRAGYSVEALLCGVQLAVLVAYRCIQGLHWSRPKVYAHLPQAIRYSVLVQTCLCVPTAVLYVLFHVFYRFGWLSWLLPAQDGTRYMLFDVLHLPVVLAAGAAYSLKLADDSFMEILALVDLVYPEQLGQANQEPLFSAALLPLTPDSAEAPATNFPPPIACIQLRYPSSQGFLGFSQRTIATCVSSLLLWGAHKVPVAASVLLGLISFQTFNEIIGTDRAVVLFMVIQVIPHSATVSLMTCYWGCKDLTHDLLMPFFSRVRFTEREWKQLMNSRGGPLLGFGAVFFVLINRFPWVSFVLFNIASVSMAYFLTELSDAPPAQANNRLIHWNVSQLLWSKDKEQAFLAGDFAAVDEGFAPVPGSSLFC